MTDKHYTVTQAAKRVKRSRRTIETWIAQGMKVTHIQHGKTITRYIDEAELLRTYRNKLRNNPARPTPAQ
jgi:transposase